MWKGARSTDPNLSSPRGVETFRSGVEDNIAEALWTLNDNFELYLGADIVDVMRRLHRVKYTIRPEE